MTKSSINSISFTLLFSTLGILAYVLLANAFNLPDDANLLYDFFWGYLFFIIGFNILGFSTVRLSRWVGQYMMQRWRMILLYACAAVLLLLINYGLLVLAKILVGVQEPLVFPNGGGRVLIILWLLDLIIMGLLIVNQSVLQNMKTQQESARLREENNKARYVALQGQLNPHFLFNSLNTLIAEIEYNPTNAVQFTRNLSDAYRYVLQCQDKKLISIGRELEFMNAYVFLHRVRLGDYIRVESRIPTEYFEALIPPLTLQLLIENVIKHNVISEKKPVRIELSVENNLLVVSNTVNLKRQSDGTGIGLENLGNRCKLMMHKELIIESTPQLFTVKVPIVNE